MVFHVAKKSHLQSGIVLETIKQFVNDDTLMSIYDSLIEPSFGYCDMVWDI